MRLIFIPEKLSEVHCVTAREARSLPFYWFSTLKFFLNPVREFPFYHSHVRYTDETKRKFEKSSASEVGVLWVAHRDRFWNLWFHHRGMKFSWNCAIVHGRFMSNLSKRTLTNRVSFQMHINKSWFRDLSNLSKRTLTNRVSGTNWEFIIGKSIRFWNKGFHNRGINNPSFQKNTHPQPPYQALAWSYR